MGLCQVLRRNTWARDHPLEHRHADVNWWLIRDQREIYSFPWTFLEYKTEALRLEEEQKNLFPKFSDTNTLLRDRK